MPPSEHARWFTEEVQPHEPALRAYLQARFPTLGDHDDLVQETYARLLRAQGNGGVRYPKAFLFTAARNAAFDLFRRRGAKPTEAVTDLVELTVLEDRPGWGS
jgi:RNA polymerase sigma-70 factor (ECF subfamily)